MTVVIPATSRPSNLHLPPGVKLETIESDVFGICDQIREISDRLFIVVMHQGSQHACAIMERCDDNVDRLIFRVKQLDGRVVKRLRRMMGMSFEDRYKEAEREEFRMKEQEEEAAFEELYERMGAPMWSQLDRDGFIQRPVSYPKVGVAKPGKAR